MSTPNPTRIIAEHLHADTFTARNRVTKERAVVTRCLCGDTVPAEDFATHVVSKLTDAGYSIVPSGRFTKHTTTVSGWRIGQTVQVNFDGCKPFTATLLNEDPPNRIEVRDENGDVMFVHASIVTAPAADGEKQ